MTFRNLDSGALITSVNAFNPRVVTAGTTVENEQTGYSIDMDSDITNRSRSCKVSIPYSYSLAAAETGTIASNFQHSTSTGSGWADYDDSDGSTSNSVTYGSTATTAAQTGYGVLEYDVRLDTAERYVRIQVTPTLSATATDTVDVAGIVIFGGQEVTPAD